MSVRWGTTQGARTTPHRPPRLRMRSRSGPSTHRTLRSSGCCTRLRLGTSRGARNRGRRHRRRQCQLRPGWCTRRRRRSPGCCRCTWCTTRDGCTPRRERHRTTWRRRCPRSPDGGRRRSLRTPARCSCICRTTTRTRRPQPQHLQAARCFRRRRTTRSPPRCTSTGSTSRCRGRRPRLSLGRVGVATGAARELCGAAQRGGARRRRASCQTREGCPSCREARRVVKYRHSYYHLFSFNSYLLGRSTDSCACN